MFEINLIKERVVPISRKILRTFIVTAYYTIILFITLVFLIMSFSEESRIAQKLIDHKTLADDFVKHKADQERYDENFARGTRVYQENEILKAPWMNKISIPFVLDQIIAKCQKPVISRFATISEVNYDAAFEIDPSKAGVIPDHYDKVFIYGYIYDDPKNPGIKGGGYNKIQEYTDKQLNALRDEFLGDKDFIARTNIKNIVIEIAPTGFREQDEVNSNVCYFRITMSGDNPLMPRPETEKKDAKKKP